MGLINLDHMKALAIRAKAYMSGHLSALAQETVNSMEEIDAVKMDKIKSVSVTIVTTGWQTDSTEDAEYPQYYDIPVQGVTSIDVPSVIISKDSQSAASACGICRTCESVTNGIRLWAKSVPTEAITAEYSIMQGYEIQGEGEQ